MQQEGLTLASKARQTDYGFFKEVEPRGANDMPRGSFGLWELILSPIPGGRRGPLVAFLARFCAAACSRIVGGAEYRIQLHHTAISGVKRKSRQRLKSASMVSSSS
jgi:hypothetical protein